MEDNFIALHKVNVLHVAGTQGQCWLLWPKCGRHEVDHMYRQLAISSRPRSVNRVFPNGLWNAQDSQFVGEKLFSDPVFIPFSSGVLFILFFFQHFWPLYKNTCSFTAIAMQFIGYVLDILLDSSNIIIKGEKWSPVELCCPNPQSTRIVYFNARANRLGMMAAY